MESAGDTSVLTHFAAAKRELAIASSVDEVKDIRDKAEAMRLYIRQAGESVEMQNQCAEIKLRAERRAGELLSQMPKARGTRGQLAGASIVKAPELVPSSPTLESLTGSLTAGRPSHRCRTTSSRTTLPRRKLPAGN